MKLLKGFLFLMLPLCAMEEKPKLGDFKRNVYSQFGEDGIIAKIFEIIGTTSKICVEFGASDGFSCSNTANLWSNDADWKGILIESKPHLYQQLVANTQRYRCIPVHKTIGISHENSIETVLQSLGIHQQIDLISMDIDGDEYYILKNLNELRPRVMICEYNPSIPSHLDVYGPYGNCIGCSVAALQRVADEKGYCLVAITDTNCIFVTKEEFSKFDSFDTNRENMRVDRYLSYIIYDYNGRYQVIANPGYIDPWGWAQQASSEKCQGNVVSLPVRINK